MTTKGKQLTGGYLYQDGHAVLSFERSVRDGSAILRHNVVEIHERFTDAQLLFKGRIVFHRYQSAAFLDLCRRARVIRAEEATYEGGSERTKGMNLLVGGLTFEFADGSYLSFHDIRRMGDVCEIVGNGFTYQPNVVEEFDGTLREWCTSQVTRIVRVKQAAAMAIA